MHKLNIERLRQVESAPLQQYNSHYPPQDGSFRGNVMEAVAFVAEEPWTDKPACACPVITQTLNSWDCWLPQSSQRERLLKPLIPRIVGTRSTAPTQEHRSRMAADWLIRELAPAWLIAAKLDAQAMMLQSLPDLTTNSVPDDVPDALRAVEADIDKTLKVIIQASRDSAGPTAGRLVYAAVASWVPDVCRESANAAGADPMCDAAARSGFQQLASTAKSMADVAAISIAWMAAWQEASDVIAPDDNPMELGEVHDEDDPLASELAAFEAGRETIMMASARSASRAAARTSLKPLVAEWQIRALSLVEKMCAA